MKNQITKAVLRYYPPIVLGIAAIATMIFVGIALDAINQLCTPDLPVQYK